MRTAYFLVAILLAGCIGHSAEPTPAQPCMPQTYLPGPPNSEPTLSAIDPSDAYAQGWRKGWQDAVKQDRSALRPIPQEMPIPRIDGPTSAEPGDLVVLSAEQAKGDAFAWGVIGLDHGRWLEVEQGTKLIFATGKQGRYTFFLFAGSMIDGQITLRSISHEVTIGTAPPPPGPGPDPDPDPQPLPDGKYKLAAAARDWASAVASPARAKAVALSGSFDSVAAMVAAGTLKDMEGAIEQLRIANNAALGSDRPAWDSFFKSVETRFNELWDAGQISSVEDLAVAWREVATGLRAAKGRAW